MARERGEARCGGIGTDGSARRIEIEAAHFGGRQFHEKCLGLVGGLEKNHFERAQINRLAQAHTIKMFRAILGVAARELGDEFR